MDRGTFQIVLASQWPFLLAICFFYSTAIYPILIRAIERATVLGNTEL